MKLNRLKELCRLIVLLFILLGQLPVKMSAQSGNLQLNLLLEPGQFLEWEHTYPIVLAGDIPGQIVLGNIEEENTLVGLLKIEGIEGQLVLHGIETENEFILNEWLNNSTKTGSLRLYYDRDSVWGYWYNLGEERRLEIYSPGDPGLGGSQIHQYQHDSLLFFTMKKDRTEILLRDEILNQEEWLKIGQQNKQCYPISTRGRAKQFCRTGSLDLYSYYQMDLSQIVHGQIPQIPHDEIFNGYLSGQLNKWADQIFQDSSVFSPGHRWEKYQLIWFEPDYITDKIVSGLMSIRFSGKEMIHSVAIVYDRKKKSFYYPDDFFRSQSSWNSDFQKMARQFIYEEYRSVIDVFPDAYENIDFHMTLTQKGILISTDFTPYFGRLTRYLGKEKYEEQLKRFVPFRKLLFY